MTLRTRAAGKVSLLASILYAAMVDLMLWLDPRVAEDRPPTYRPRPWLGVVFILLLGLGLAQAGVLAVEAIQVVSHRLSREDVQ